MNKSTSTYHNHLQTISNQQNISNNKLCNLNKSFLCNSSSTLSTHSIPLHNHYTNHNHNNKSNKLLMKSSINALNIESLSMINVKEILERLKNEVEVERNKRTLITRQHNQDMTRLTTRSKVENRILLSALKHAENKAKMYRNEYQKLKTKVQAKYINSEQQNPKMSIVNNTLDNNEAVLNGQTSLNTQSTSTWNRNIFNDIMFAQCLSV
ncbi:hypothetical protein EWB00_005188 [Schistosoma japonicum]|uniref:Uncharacterized protein n=1 Tax=Schistosoma japonicum TaxID=6182 RepID=A0A4Z2D3E4_SCHJA|nr:hypothetical protein EWB00_005188 [Schistosoma japonicum]